MHPCEASNLAVKEVGFQASGPLQGSSPVPAGASVLSAAQEGVALNDADYQAAPVLEKIRSIVTTIASDEPKVQCEQAVRLRKLLSKERDPPIQAVIDTGVIPRLVNFLTCHEVPLLQFEAAWALCNIASGAREQTQTVIDAGAVPIFIELLASTQDNVREQAVWALGNIAGDGPPCRDLVLSLGALDPLLQLLKDSYKGDGKQKVSMLRNATWALSNLCRGKAPPPNFHVVKQSLSVLAALIYCPDEEVLTDACWSLSYLSDGDNVRIQAVIESGVCRRLVELLKHHNPGVVTPALRTIGNIVTGNDVQTQVVLNCALLPSLLNLLEHPKETIRKETCWSISNITAGSHDQIQMVIDGGIIEPLLRVLHTGEPKTRKEAAWAISNATSGGNDAQIMHLVTVGAAEALCGALNLPQGEQGITRCLEAIQTMLKQGQLWSAERGLESNACTERITASGAEDAIRALSQCGHSLAQQILEVYFEVMITTPPEPKAWSNPSECSICLGPFTDVDTTECRRCESGQERHMLDCGHVYHKNCIQMALGQQPKCPICQKPARFRIYSHCRHKSEKAARSEVLERIEAF